MTDKCAGENCASIDGFNHSVECLFEHFTAYTGAHREPIDVLRKIKKAYFDGYEAAAPSQPQEVVLATDYAALEAECKRLLDLLADWSSHFTGPKVIGGPLSSLRERTDAALLGGDQPAKQQEDPLEWSRKHGIEEF